MPTATCSACSKPFRIGEPRVRGHRAQWHPACRPAPAAPPKDPRYANVGRKPDPAALSHHGKWLQVRIDTDLHALIATAASKRGETIAEYVRDVVGRAAARGAQ